MAKKRIEQTDKNGEDVATLPNFAASVSCDVGVLEKRAKSQLQRKLLAWFRQHARDLPWRRDRNPYRVWVSEIMLQQTQVATVIPYFERFLAEFPDVGALAAAPEDRVLRLWEGLGYYRRARQLHAAAKRIVEVHAGKFPRDSDAVRALPGIGRYTAGAILSIAFDARQPILEANTIRLFSRLTALRGDVTRGAEQSFLWQVAESLLPSQDAGAFNQALMELGSQICTPRDPRCDECPLALLCPTRANRWQAEIPAPKRKATFEDVTEVAVVVRRGRKILLRRCGAEERWAGLWDFPRFPIQATTDSESRDEILQQTRALFGVDVDLGKRLTTIKHGVTRFRITLHCHEATWQKGNASSEDHRWVLAAELHDFPLSTTGRKISKLLVGKRDSSSD